MNGYWVGPYAPGGSGIFGGFIDYMNMINARDGGVGGVKLTYEKCETEYNNARGVECYEREKKKGPDRRDDDPSAVDGHHVLADRQGHRRQDSDRLGRLRTHRMPPTGACFPYVFPLITNYWSQNTAKIKFIGSKEGGMDKLKGKKIVNIYHDSAYGKETIPILDAQAKKYGFTVTHIPVAHPGNEQGAQWLQIRQIKPDWVILRGWGVMNPVALKAAGEGGLPARSHHRRVVVGRRGGHDSRGRRGEGLHRGRLQRRGRELPGDPGDQEVRVRRRARARWTTRRGSAASITTAVSCTAS